MTLEELMRECTGVASRPMDEEPIPVAYFGIDAGTYRTWKANTGNCKARRRWRRRDIPNSQRETRRMVNEARSAFVREAGAYAGPRVEFTKENGEGI